MTRHSLRSVVSTPDAVLCKPWTQRSSVVTACCIAMKLLLLASHRLSPISKKAVGAGVSCCAVLRANSQMHSRCRSPCMSMFTIVESQVGGTHAMHSSVLQRWLMTHILNSVAELRMSDRQPKCSAAVLGLWSPRNIASSYVSWTVGHFRL